MRKSTIPAALAALFILCSGFLAAQASTQVVVLAVADFTSEKNLEIYEFVKSDSQFEVINSCDALGWVVLRSTDISMSKATAKIYVELKMSELLGVKGFEVIEDKQAIDVLEDCRAEMLRQTEMK